MNDIIYKTIFVLLTLKLIMTMYHKRYGELGTYKRVVSLYQSIWLGVIYIVMSIIKAKGLNEKLIIVALALGVVSFYLLRSRLFPYKFKCENCNKKLKISQVLYIDSTKCSECE